MTIAGDPVDARNVRITDRLDGRDAGFSLVSTEGIDPVLFARPSAVQIRALIGMVWRVLFDGFPASTVEDGTIQVECVDGKRFLETAMLEDDYSGDQDVVAHAESILSAARSDSYYAPELDADVSATADVSYSTGQRVRSVLDDLFEQFEWVVRDGVILVRETIGTDRRDEVVIQADERSVETDILGVANVIHGTGEGNETTIRDQESIEILGYAMGDTERVRKDGGLDDHVQSVLDRRKLVRPVWTLEKVLPEPIYVEAGDSVSVDLADTPLHEAPASLRVAEVTYDLSANTQNLVLSSNATLPASRDERVKQLQEQVRNLSL